MNSRAAEILIEARKLISDPPMRGTNPHFKSKYALLKDVRDVIEAALSQLDAAFYVAPSVREDGVEEMVGTLVYKDGDGYGSQVLCGMKMFGTDPQKQGSAQTYARRYLSCAAFSIIGETDDDGNAATISTELTDTLNALMKDKKATREELLAIVKSVAGVTDPKKVKPEMQAAVVATLQERFGA